MTVELSDTSPAAAITVARDDEVIVRLAENPTTGFRWELSASGTGELAVVDDRFVAGAGGNAPGAGGYRVVRYIARKAGSVQIEARKGRAWDAASYSEKKVFSLLVT